MLFKLDSNVDIPTVGDWVWLQYFKEDTISIIHEILPRKTILKRKDASKNIEYQLIAANIDVAFIMQGLDANFNINRLERYLVMANESKINPITPTIMSMPLLTMGYHFGSFTLAISVTSCKYW